LTPPTTSAPVANLDAFVAALARFAEWLTFGRTTPLVGSRPSHPGFPASDTVARVREPMLVDSLGKACPIPVIELAKAVARLAVGEEVLVLSDDPGSKVDIPVWCRMKGQKLITVEPGERGWLFHIRRTT
jgi:TusA-related sulfurtransferase